MNLFSVNSGGRGAQCADPRTSWALARARMVSGQLACQGRMITNPRVLLAMGKVPRHEFVLANLTSHAYEDMPLPIGQGQTISQPYIVAYMTEALEPESGQRILEIGTGSGYQAAVLAELGVEVFTVEILDLIARQARRNLAQSGYARVHARIGDGHLGWPEAAPFDAVMVTCAPRVAPQSLLDQVKQGGRVVIPIGPPEDQRLILLRRRGAEFETLSTLPVRFVPMTGMAQLS